MNKTKLLYCIITFSLLCSCSAPNLENSNKKEVSQRGPSSNVVFPSSDGQKVLISKPEHLQLFSNDTKEFVFKIKTCLKGKESLNPIANEAFLLNGSRKVVSDQLGCITWKESFESSTLHQAPVGDGQCFQKDVSIWRVKEGDFIVEIPLIVKVEETGLELVDGIFSQAPENDCQPMY